MATSQNSLLLLSDSLDKIRQLSNDTTVNTMIQDKKYLELAERMAEVSRNANTASGVFFDMYMQTRPKESPDLYTEPGEHSEPQ